MASRQVLNMVGSARYRILVQGRLEQSWSGRLGGMIISTSIQEDGSVLTWLEGELADQAALVGTINALSSLQLPIVSVSILGDGRYS